MQNSFKARACACGRGNVRGGASFGSVSGPAMTCAGVSGCARPRHTRRASHGQGRAGARGVEGWGWSSQRWPRAKAFEWTGERNEGAAAARTRSLQTARERARP